MKEKKTLITTHTGEPSQPFRIYYQVVKPKTVLGVFKKLRCVYFEQALKRWRWLYEHEAKKLRLEMSYSKIPKEVKPIVIGDFYSRGDQELLLEVRSFERVIKAINHAQAAQVPLVVAINKIDKPEAQPDRVKQELSEYGLVLEEWGGDTIMVPVSAVQRSNLDELLEMILLVAEISDLQANPERPAKSRFGVFQ